MTRAGKPRSRKAAAAAFAGDPEAAVLRVLAATEGSLTPSEISQALRETGVPKDEIDRRWPRVREKIRSHPQVLVESARPGHPHRYSWAPSPRTISAAEALELIATGEPIKARRAELAALVRAALELAASAPGEGEPAGPLRTEDLDASARLRQARIDGVRALAELAGEVEELTANESSPRALIHRVRARAQRSGLAPIGVAGDETTFDRKRHRSIGAPIRDGTPVVVVRPGYVWSACDEEVLIEKAVVEE